jgi:WD40 repeat protein
VWDAETGKQLALLKGHTSPLASASFSVDCRRVVTAAHDNTVRVWDAETGKQITLLMGLGGGFLAASISGDGRRVVTMDDTARVWDAETGEQLAMLKWHKTALASASFSGDGRRIVTTADDTTAQVWDAETGKLMLTIQSQSSRLLTATLSADGSRIQTAGWADSGLSSIRVSNFDTRPARETFRKYLEAPPPRAVPDSGRCRDSILTGSLTMMLPNGANAVVDIAKPGMTT